MTPWQPDNIPWQTFIFSRQPDTIPWQENKTPRLLRPHPFFLYICSGVSNCGSVILKPSFSTERKKHD